AHIFADRLIHNFQTLRSRCDAATKICVPLKADAYGHGLSVVAPVLAGAGADYAAIANIDEAIELRGAGWARPILLLGNALGVCDPGERRARLDAILTYDLTITISDQAPLADIHLAAASSGRTIDVHVKVDTGMGRMGLVPKQAAA